MLRIRESGCGVGRARPSDQALAVPAEPKVSALSGFDPSREATIIKSLILRCEEATGPDRTLDADISRLAFPLNSTKHPFLLCPVTSSIDEALLLLRPPADWRRLTPTSTSTYAASPYGGESQIRYDGYGATVALQICSAALKLRLAPVLKAIATEARRAGTVKQGPVHEGAGPQDIARKPSP